MRCFLLAASILTAPAANALAQVPARAWLGVNIDHVKQEEPRTQDRIVGVFVAYVWGDGPARDAGIQLWDILLEVDGHGIGNVEDAICLIAMHAPGDEVRITLVRGSERKIVMARLARWPDTLPHTTLRCPAA
jgi:S1-C subfamily serine protease